MAQEEQELLQAVLDARDKVNELDEALSQAKELKSQAEAKLIEHMDNAELKSFKSSTFGCTVSRKETLYVSIVPEKKEEAFRWIEEDCSRGDMIKPSIHNKTLSSFVGEMLKKGEKIPQELFKYFFKPEIAITNTK